MSFLGNILNSFSRSPVQRSSSRASLLDMPLLQLTERDSWTLRDAVGGAFIFGGPGSGKTSGPGKHLAMAFLAAGMGGMVLAAKKGEVSRWITYAKEAGRERDVILFSPDHPQWRYNPLDVELRRSSEGGGYTQNVTALLNLLIAIAEGEKKEGGADPFWSRAILVLSTHCCTVLHHAGEIVSLRNIQRMIDSAPRRDDQGDEYDDDDWRDNSYCWQCLVTATLNAETDTGPMLDLEMAATYLCDQFPHLPERTRHSVLATLQGIALPFSQEPLRSWCGTDTTLHLEDAIERGAIIIVAFELKEFNDVGRIVGQILKFSFQTAIERRIVTSTSRPCFLFVDEAHEFVNPRDANFAATARESMACQVYISQNLSNLQMAIKERHHLQIVEALLANLTTHIYAALSDATTAKYAAERLAQTWQTKAGSSMSTGQQMSSSSNTSQQLAYQVQPSQFFQLQKGGPPLGMVETILVQSGRAFSTTGAPYARVAFPQTP